MGSAVSKFPRGAEWKSLYTAALFAGNPANISRRIADAEAAIMRRESELQNISGDHIEEQQNLEDAMYTLGALRKTVELRRRMRAGVPAEWEQTGT